MEIIAHRGASADAPENTLAAFNLGWRHQADAGELDTRLSRDGQAVVIHDAGTKRTAGFDKPVAEQTLAELRSLDAGVWKGPQWQGEKIPILAEALATIPDGKRMFIEIKCGPEILPELKRVIHASGKTPGQLPIITFNYEVAKQAKERFPCHEVSLLHDWKADKEAGRPLSVNDLITRTQAANLDGVDVKADPALDKAIVQKVQAAGLKFYVWTVDDAETAQRLAAAGVDGITTNRPQWLRELLRRAVDPSL